MPRRIGYTTGVFDMFHIGHLNILRRARQQCDYLVVGVATDEFALSRKGRLPVVPFWERVEIVRNVRYVDEVVPLSHPDRLRAWRELRFDVLFKGDDWRGSSELTEVEQAFEALGVELVFFPYTPATSTTARRREVFREDLRTRERV